MDYQTLELFKKHEIYSKGMSLEEFLISYKNFQSVKKSHEWVDLHVIVRKLEAEFNDYLENLGFDLPESKLRRIVESLKVKLESSNREKNKNKFKQATCYMSKDEYSMFVNENSGHSSGGFKYEIIDYVPDNISQLEEIYVSNVDLYNENGILKEELSEQYSINQELLRENKAIKEEIERLRQEQEN